MFLKTDHLSNDRINYKYPFCLLSWKKLGCNNQGLHSSAELHIQARACAHTLTNRYTWNRTSAINTDTLWHMLLCGAGWWLLMVHCHRWVEEKKERDDLCRAHVFCSACTQSLLWIGGKSGNLEIRKRKPKDKWQPEKVTFFTSSHGKMSAAYAI